MSIGISAKTELRTQILWLTVAVVASRTAAVYLFQLFDDAFITFRFVENFVHGDGLVYNLGERVQGITTPLWGMLLSVPSLLGIPMEWSSRVLALTAELGVVILTFHLLGQEGGTTAAILTVWLFALDPYLAKTAMGGMESSVTLLVYVATVLQVIQRRYLWASLLAALSVFLRPESLVFALILVGYAGYTERRFLSQPAFLGMGIILFGTLLLYLYYGDLIPQSVRGKFLYPKNYDTLIQLVLWPARDPIQKLLTITTVLGLPVAWKHSRFVRVFGLWALTLLLIWISTQAFLWAWYCVPVFFFKCLVTGVAADKFLTSWARVRGLLSTRTVSMLLGFLVLIPWMGLAIVRGPSPVRTHVYQPLQKWCAGKSFSGETAYGLDFGAFGYYSGLKIVDGPGLVYPKSISEYGGETRRIILGECPEYAFVTNERSSMSIMLSPEMAKLYVPVVRFSEFGMTELPSSVEEVSTVWSHDFIIFERRDISGLD